MKYSFDFEHSESLCCNKLDFYIHFLNSLMIYLVTSYLIYAPELRIELLKKFYDINTCILENQSKWFLNNRQLHTTFFNERVLFHSKINIVFKLCKYTHTRVL